MARKTIVARGKQVQVTDTDVAGVSPARLLEATVGSSTVKRTITFGAIDGPRPTVTLSQLQQDLNTARRRVAEEAAWKEELEQLLNRLD